MDYDYIAGEIEGIFNPEPDEDDDYREWRAERLGKHHGLDFTYLRAQHRTVVRACGRKEKCIRSLRWPSTNYGSGRKRAVWIFQRRNARRWRRRNITRNVRVPPLAQTRLSSLALLASCIAPR